jgi:pimeloyl-ACP methyl ester carboxylesterase
MKTRIQLLQGMAQLAGDGTLGAIGAVEGMHLAIVASVARALPFGGLVERGTAFTYARVRDIATFTRRTADVTLAMAGRHARDDGGRGPGGASVAWLAALNGAVGDHLEASANPLAITLGLCRDGRALDPDSRELRSALEASGGTLVLFAHGLGMSDLRWHEPGSKGFGARLEQEGIGLALQIRYNSGRRIPANGRDLSRLLQQVHEAHPDALRRLVLVGHSMGGLVCRSACEHARRHRSNWASVLDEVICLGTPHFGAPLERFGDSLSALLAATPWTRSLAAVAEARSAGVKDLRHGWSSDLDRGANALQRPGATAQGLPFDGRVNWRLVAASLSTQADGQRAHLIGDGLVPVPSALGQHPTRGRSLHVPASHRRVFTRLGHMDLLTHPDVYAQIREWIGGSNRAMRTTPAK